MPVSTSVAVAPTFTRDGAARVCELLGEGGHVRDGVCGGVLGAYVGHARVGSFAGFGEGVVARVKVFAFLARVDEVSEEELEGVDGRKERGRKGGRRREGNI